MTVTLRMLTQQQPDPLLPVGVGSGHETRSGVCVDSSARGNIYLRMRSGWASDEISWGHGGGGVLQVIESQSQQEERGMEQDAGSGESFPEKKVPAQRRVSFKPDDPVLELREVPPRPLSGNVTEKDETTDGPDKYRGRSHSEIAPTVIERFLVTRERKWSVTLASLVAAIPAFLLGLTLGYPSNALLDLTGEATELPPEFLFSTLRLSLFTVS